VGRLICTTTMTVDAVTDVGDWFVSEGEHDRVSKEQFAPGTALLIGRTTFEGLAGYWTQQEGEWADLLNPMPKFVASRTATGPLEWNATLIEGDVADGVARLKEQLEGDLFLIGCGELARHLLAHSLVDEIRFWLHPAIQGEGARPFEGATAPMRLLDVTSFDSGVTLLRYAPVSP
jgi:dihydrofolate reductase